MTFIKRLFQQSRYALFYGVAMALLIFVLKWLQWKYLIADHSIEVYIGLIAVFFTVLGIWVASQLLKPRIETVIIEKEIFHTPENGFTINETELAKLNLTEREYEVLQLISQGHSNAEIAERLFLSLSTIKTHISNLFVKLDVKSRTQAVEKARRLRITPL